LRVLRLLHSAVAMTVAVAALTACGRAIKDTPNTTNGLGPGTGGGAAVVAHPASLPSKQEIIKAQGCLMRERVRPAKHTPYRPQVPHGAGEVTRNGLPMTPQEYEASVRRCLMKTNSASARAARKNSLPNGHH
jgi:hypothetical protein